MSSSGRIVKMMVSGDPVDEGIVIFESENGWQ
jgi:hypothetical protein